MRGKIYISKHLSMVKTRSLKFVSIPYNRLLNLQNFFIQKQIFTYIFLIKTGINCNIH